MILPGHLFTEAFIYRGMLGTELVAPGESSPDLNYKHFPQVLRWFKDLQSRRKGKGNATSRVLPQERVHERARIGCNATVEIWRFGCE